MGDTAKELEAMRQAAEALEPLEPSAKTRVLMWLADSLGVESLSSATRLDEGNETFTSSGGQQPTPKQFLATKKPSTAVERVTCLGYYLASFRNQAHFKTADLTALNVEAAAPSFSNISQAAKDAVKAQYLASAPKAHRQVTALGEQVVEALPDRAAVKAIVAETPRVRRRSRRTATKRAQSE